MIQSFKTAVIGLLALLLSAGPVLAYDQEQVGREPNGGEMFVDTVVARPLGLFAMVVGTAAFILSLPFTLPSHSADSAAKMLVSAPTQFTFKRPLGRFISCDEQPDFCK
jgi:hypothetical protein